MALAKFSGSAGPPKQVLMPCTGSVLVIEHNMDVIKSADYIIDLGPEGGKGGGRIVATGTPEEVAKVKKSYTGQFLKKFMDRQLNGPAPIYD